MKKVFLAIAVASVFTACNNGSTETPKADSTAPKMDSAAPKAADTTKVADTSKKMAADTSKKMAADTSKKK